MISAFSTLLSSRIGKTPPRLTIGGVFATFHLFKEGTCASNRSAHVVFLKVNDCLEVPYVRYTGKENARTQDISS